MNTVMTDMKSIKNMLKKTGNAEFELDLRSMNVIDATRAAVLLSSVFYGKNPDSKIKCRLYSAGIKSFISGLSVPNIEFI